MENASKALIMAGAILVSLALVGLGVYIFSQAKSNVEVSDDLFDITAIQTANAQLTPYSGKQVKGSTVKEFLNLVDTLNTRKTFPQSIRAGEVTNYQFVATGTVITGDNRAAVEENMYYEVALQDKLPTASPDGYLDTYEIVGY